MNGEDKTGNAVYSLFAEGEPKAQPRPRRGKYGNFYNPGTADAWKEAVQAAFLTRRKPAIRVPAKLTVHFFFHRPALPDGKTTPHTGRPDIDNLTKSVMDALTGIEVWEDDRLVSGVEAKKYWTGGKPGARIIIETDR
jgi:Holliday junction resolvase RusA-like endonuclease